MINKYLIEYEVNFNNKKKIGKDDLFSGEGVFYVRAKNKKEARSLSLKKIRWRFKRLKIEITRLEETHS